MKLILKKIGDVAVPATEADQEKWHKFSDAEYEVDMKNLDSRTSAQNRALHKMYTLVAQRLADKNLPIVKVIKPDVEFSPEAVKEYMWRPIQKAVVGKASTTKLNKKEIDLVYEVFNELLGEKFGIHIPFPSKELWNEEKLDKRL